MIEIMKPTIECVEVNEDSSYGKFVVAPLERGYGTTLGNSLRRVLLSSLSGAAVTSIRVEGVYHEFSTIPGVIEDMTGQVEFAAFPTVFSKYRELFEGDKPVKISGRISMREDKANTLMIDEVAILEKKESRSPQAYRAKNQNADEKAPPEKAENHWLDLRFNSETESKFNRIIEVLKRYPGNDGVVLRINGKNLIKEKWVSGTDSLIEVLENLLGRENVSLRKGK